MNKPVSIFCISFLFVFSSYSQTLKKTTLTIPEMKNKGAMGINASTSTLDFVDADDDNFYLHLIERGSTYVNTNSTHSILVVNRNLTKLQKKPLTIDKKQTYLGTISTEEQIIVLTSEIKKKEVSIIKKAFSKSTMKLYKEEAIATFELERSESFRLYSKKSADKQKVGLFFMVADKKGDVNSYYAAILDGSGEIAWQTIEGLNVGNEVFQIDDIAVTNNWEMYLLFNSRPLKERKAEDKKSYLDVIMLAENDKKNANIPFTGFIDNAKLHILKNGNLFIGVVLSNSVKDVPSQYQNLIISKDHFDVLSNNSKKISFAKESYTQVIGYLPKTFDYTVAVKEIAELENGNIAVLCEQTSNVNMKINDMPRYMKARGSVVSFITDGEGTILSQNYVEKYQKQIGGFNVEPKMLHVSIFPFTYGNKIGYLFNDAVKNYTKSSKNKDNFSKVDGKDAGIYLAIEEDGGKPKIIALTGTSPANKFVCDLLFVENDKLILLTRDKKAAYIETVSLP